MKKRARSGLEKAELVAGYEESGLTRRAYCEHSKWCRASDKPIAGLLGDLKARSLLPDRLVVWGGEFGRTPFNQASDGRYHNPCDVTTWMAGGGVKGGQYIGSTDERGLRAAERPVHVHDLHATVLCLNGPGPFATHVPAQRPDRAAHRFRRRSGERAF